VLWISVLQLGLSIWKGSRVTGRICGCGEVRVNSLLGTYPHFPLQTSKSAEKIPINMCYVGAMLEEPIKEGDSGPPKMKGSAMLIGAKTKEEVIERVKKDVYVNEGVWNVEDIQIIPFRSAIRKAL
jgi:hypothetical protein